jgi:hypothetical protein
MNKHIPIWLAALVTVGLIALTIMLIGNQQAPPLISGALSGQAGIATSSTIEVGPDEVTTIFSRNTYCGNRQVDTFGQAITLSFHADIAPSEFVGHQIAASTSKMLESEYFGCGNVTASAPASTTITRTVFSQ